MIISREPKGIVYGTDQTLAAEQLLPTMVKKIASELKDPRCLWGEKYGKISFELTGKSASGISFDLREGQLSIVLRMLTSNVKANGTEEGKFILKLGGVPEEGIKEITLELEKDGVSKIVEELSWPIGRSDETQEKNTILALSANEDIRELTVRALMEKISCLMHLD